MTNLWIAAVAFVVLHRLVPRSPVREPIARLVGERTYIRVFGLVSILALTWLGAAHADTRGPPGNAALFVAPAHARVVSLPLQLRAMLLTVVGLTTRNPGMVVWGDVKNVRAQHLQRAVRRDLRGEQRLRLGEIGWRRSALALAVLPGVALSHSPLFGSRVMP
jgi:uncharacterized membrane protein